MPFIFNIPIYLLEVVVYSSLSFSSYEGINDTIIFTNNQLLTKTSGQIKRYALDDIVKGIEICAQKIIEEIGDL